jgi:hypothetical protein
MKEVETNTNWRKERDKKQKLFLKGHKGKDGRVQTTLERELVIAFMRKRNWKERKKKKLANRQTDRRWASLQKKCRCVCQRRKCYREAEEMVSLRKECVCVSVCLYGWVGGCGCCR